MGFYFRWHSGKNGSAGDMRDFGSDQFRNHFQ